MAPGRQAVPSSRRVHPGSGCLSQRRAPKFDGHHAARTDIVGMNEAPKSDPESKSGRQRLESH